MSVINRTRVVGHRGAPRRAPENTLDSVAAAAAAGADGVEVDLRLARDGTVVVIHDSTVDRTTAGTGRVSQMDAVDLGALGIPTLDELLALASTHRLWVNLEVKVAKAALARALGRIRFPHGGVVSSFLPDALEQVARHAPALPRALLTERSTSAADGIAAARAQGAWSPSMARVKAEPGCIAAAREAGLSVHVWTVNDPDDIRMVGQAGAESVITDVPDVARAALSG